MSKIKTESEIKILKEGGKKLASILRAVAKETKPGVSTWFLNEKTKSLMEKAGARPAFLNYVPDGAMRPYPAVICISINDEIVHGIPNENPKTLKDGDVVKLDRGISYKGLLPRYFCTTLKNPKDYCILVCALLMFANLLPSPSACCRREIKLYVAEYVLSLF